MEVLVGAIVGFFVGLPVWGFIGFIFGILGYQAAQAKKLETDLSKRVVTAMQPTPLRSHAASAIDRSTN